MNNFAKICGRRYSGSPERVTLGALYIIEYDNLLFSLILLLLFNDRYKRPRSN